MSIEAQYDSLAVNLREVMIPMRDGVRLQTVIVSPRQPGGPLPFVLDRGPYGVPSRDQLIGLAPGRLGAVLYDNYYVVFQNTRGRFASEGRFEMLRPPCAPDNRKCVDETTDAWDTVDWVVKNVPNNNGRAGITGGSYDGWAAVMAGLHPHAALKAIIEEASPADMFLGDDFHHNGAFRLSYGFEYSALLETSATENFFFKFDRPDTYDWFLALGSLSNVDKHYFGGKLPTWESFTRHPNYDRYWKERALAPYLNAVKVPILNVAGWWDQEDFYGPQSIYQALEQHDTQGWNYFVAGPWNHGSFRGNGRRLGALDFGSSTGRYYRDHIYQPWLDYWLRGQGEMRMAEATVFETGSNEWRRYQSWPLRNGVTTRRLYLRDGRRLSFDPPTLSGYDEYISDPANPVPYRSRPIAGTFQDAQWSLWLVQDQRFVNDRRDIAWWKTAPLTEDVNIAGDIVAELYASTSGTDSDWVVKLIDVYPESAHAPVLESGMRGFELIVASEIFRARFRNSFERPESVVANQAVRYAIDLHTNAHSFAKGHRIMVQVQSTWFPLYDRNPQKFVPNIFEARPADYVKATQRIYRGATEASAIVLPVVMGYRAGI